MKRKIWIGIVIVFAIFVTTTVIKKFSKPVEMVSSIEEVEVAKVERGTIELKVLFTGNVEAKDAIQIFPRASGKISKKLLAEGDSVNRDQAIMLIDRDEVGYTFKPMPVVSPIDGLVGTISVDVGSNVGPQNPVAVVVQPGQMRVKLDVPAKYLNVIQLGTPVKMKVDSLGDGIFEGTIVTSSPVIDEKTRTAKVEVEMTNKDGILRHGMFAKIDLVVERRGGVIVVPYNSISWEGAKQFVYKIDGEKVFRKEVKVGMRNETHVELLEGASEGDTIVVGKLLDLKDGEQVVVRK